MCHTIFVKLPETFLASSTNLKALLIRGGGGGLEIGSPGTYAQFLGITISYTISDYRYNFSDNPTTQTDKKYLWIMKWC